MSSPDKMRVLFVDDQPVILELIQLTVRAMQEEWETCFAHSAEEALDCLSKAAYGLVVTDMHLPGLTGAQLLNEVMRRSPATIRIILSGGGDKDLMLKCVGATHQFLPKPFTLAELKHALQRIQGLRQRLHSPEIQTLVAGRKSLPSIPAVYFEVIDALQDPDCPIERLGSIIAKDPALTVKLLQLVNSAFLGLAHQVSSADEAVLLLGTGLLRSLALGLHLFSVAWLPRAAAAPLEKVWHHSLRVAYGARCIVRLETGDEKLMEEAFTAGLLHDVGKIVLAQDPKHNYARLLDSPPDPQHPLIESEEAVFHATHAEAGAYLLDLWGLPHALVEAVAFHHEPRKSSEKCFGALTAVHAANVLQQSTANSGAGDDSMDHDYLEELGLAHRVKAWRDEMATT